MTTADSQAPPLQPAPADVPLLAAPEPKKPPESGGRRHAKAISAIALAAFLVVAFAIGWYFHHRRADAAEDANQRQREQMPMASVIAVKRSPGLSEVLLPGSLSPLTEAALYARAAGYVRRRYVDIGDTVKKGQVLAEIESPELDQQVVQGLAATAQARQQLNQVRASVVDARAKLDLARVGWQRWDVLQQANAVAKQDADQKRQEYESAQASLQQAEANVGSAEENVRAAEANQRRLAALQNFEKLRAPFAGVITARGFDEGALVGSNGATLTGGTTSSSTSSTSGGSTGSAGGGDSSGSGGSASTGLPLFRIAQVDRLRVYVTVPQGNATAIQVGSDATVLVQEFAQPVAGRVSRTARALDPDSRTLLTEVQIDNRDHRLLPGMYAQVRFASARSNPPLLVPGEALIVRGNGMRLATIGPLDADERSRLAPSPDANCARQVHLRTVAVGRDYGTEIEVTKGLQDGDFVVVDPGDSVHDKAVLLPHLQPDDKGGGDAKNDDKKAGGSAGGASQANQRGGDQKGGDQKGGDQKGGDQKGGDQKGGDQKGGDHNGGGSSQGGGKKQGGGSGGGAGQGASDEEEQQRREAQQTCVEDAARQQSAQRRQHPEAVPDVDPGQPVPSGLAPGGESDKTPAGIQSPSMAAPTQGRKK